MQSIQLLIVKYTLTNIPVCYNATLVTEDCLCLALYKHRSHPMVSYISFIYQLITIDIKHPEMMFIIGHDEEIFVHYRGQDAMIVKLSNMMDFRPGI